MGAQLDQKNERFLNIKEVKKKTSLSTSDIYRRMQRLEFPRQVRLGPKRVAWPESQLEDWIREVKAGRTYHCPEPTSGD